MKRKRTFFKTTIGLLVNSASLLLLATATAAAQMPTPHKPPETEDFTWWYATLFVMLLGLAGAVGWWLSTKKSAAEQDFNKKQKKQSKNDTIEFNSLDADKELAWLRKNNSIINRRGKKQDANNFPEGSPRAGNAFSGDEDRDGVKSASPVTAFSLPVYSFQKLERARPYNLLPISNDEALLSAVEQTHEEFEDDEEIRELAVRILAAFKTRNSVEALSQVALYDLSSGVRSKAVSILADFDHESVFEGILLACADPTREVRAAAARGFSRLSFDRADAWTRIAETGEQGRMRHAARAALEGGFVDRVFDRLIHHDPKQAYEAVTLLALLIKAGETESVFAKLRSGRNPEVWRAILHVIKITDDHGILNELYALLEQKGLAPELKKAIDETIEAVGLLAA